MKIPSDCRGLVTGASSGIGREIAWVLAEHGCHLVLTARREVRLAELQKNINSKFGQIQIEIVKADLSTRDGAKLLWSSVNQKPLHILVNNAGFGSYAPFTSTTWSKTHDLLQCNITSLAQLSHLFLNQSPKPLLGYIMNIASVLSFTSMRNFSTYAASKAFVRSFSESIADELDSKNFSMTCVSPGPVDTEFHQVSGSIAEGFAKRFKLNPRKCAEIAVEAMFKRKKHCSPGFMAKAMVTGMHLTPRGFLGNLSGKFLPKP